MGEKGKAGMNCWIAGEERKKKRKNYIDLFSCFGVSLRSARLRHDMEQMCLKTALRDSFCSTHKLAETKSRLAEITMCSAAPPSPQSLEWWNTNATPRKLTLKRWGYRAEVRVTSIPPSLKKKNTNACTSMLFLLLFFLLFKQVTDLTFQREDNGFSTLRIHHCLEAQKKKRGKTQKRQKPEIPTTENEKSIDKKKKREKKENALLLRTRT